MFDTTFTISDAAIIAATLLGPVVAIQLDRFLQRLNDRDKRKREVFQVLMATRASPARTLPRHVEALNMIDVNFHSRSRSDKKVRTAWRAYFDSLYAPNDPTQQSLVNARREDMLWDLLYEMSLALGYDFDKTHIKTHIYTPIAHGEEAEDLYAIRKGLVALTRGEASIPMSVMPWPTTLAARAEKDAK